MGRRRKKQIENWRNIILSILIILCLYFILTLFRSSPAGNHLRTTWGGAVLVPLLFGLYLCIAKLLKMRVPYIPRQILGTIQLYISFAFMLGLLKETGWDSELTLFLPGAFGHGLARFFVLNLGVFLTFLLVIASFILSAFFFGLKILRIQLPDFSGSYPDTKINSEYENQINRRSRRKPVRDAVELSFPEETPDSILFMKNIPTPKFKDEEEDSAQLSMTRPTLVDIPTPKLKEPEEDFYDDYDDNFEDENINLNISEEKNTTPEIKENENNYAIEIIDNLLASIDAGALSMPEKKRPKNIERKERKIRRPLPVINLAEEFENIMPEIKSENEEKNSDFPPPLEIFGPAVKFEPVSSSKDNLKNLEKTGKNIIATLKNFGVNASIADTLTGPSVTQYLLELAPGMKVNKISGLSEELAMSLAVVSVRIEAPIPGTRYVGIEIPNQERKKISLRSVFESEEFKNNSARLPLPLGVQFDGKILIRALENMPHLLVAGDKSSGKNTFLNTSILSICSVRRPEDLRLILIDPRHVEFALYEGLPHLLTPPVFNYDEAVKALLWAFNEMEKRTANFAKNKVRNLDAYNRKLQKKERLPEIVIFINELSDLMYQSGNENEIEDLIVRLAQKSATAGIYMIIAAQRPSADVITTLIRSNISARAAFALSSQSYSKNIIGITDADKLTGQGDLLFKDSESQRIFRLQAPFINEEKISEFVEYLEGTLQPIENLNFKEEEEI